MKKITLATVFVLLLSIAPTAVFAQGHCGGRAQRNLSVCQVSDCNEAGTHWHNNNCYYGHYYGDGHDYHQQNNCARGHCR